MENISNTPVSVAEAAEILNVSISHVYNLVFENVLIPLYDHENNIRFNPNDVQKILEESIEFRKRDAESIASRDTLEDEIFDSME